MWHNRGMKNIRMDDLKALQTNQQTLILDVRSKEEFDEGHVPGAMNCDHESVASMIDVIKKYSHVYVYCRGGARADYAAQVLLNAGIDAEIFCVANEGMPAWSGPIANNGKTLV